MRERRVAMRQALVIAACVAALLILVWAFLLARLDPEAVAEMVRGAGRFGPMTLTALLVLQCVVAPLPSEPLLVGAGFVYGPNMGFAIGWFGVLLGASACFGLSQRLGRPFAVRFVRPDRLAALDEYVGERGRAATFSVVVCLRLFAFMSFDVLSYACGLTSFPFRWFLLATALGAVPKVWAFTYFGATVGHRVWWLDAAILAGMSSIVLVPWVARRWRQRSRRARIVEPGA